MLARDSDSHISNPTPRPLAAWMRVSDAIDSDTEANFVAGAALAKLDALVRAEQPWNGLWRQRLAYAAAAASLRLIGRREDEAALRDLWQFQKSHESLGPAGVTLEAWLRLTRGTPQLTATILESGAHAFGVYVEDIAPDILASAQDTANASTTAIAAAAEVANRVMQLRPQAELLALWLADLVLARHLRWPFALPLLVSQLAAPALRTANTKRTPRPNEPGWQRTVALAYALAAAHAVDRAGDIARRGERLLTVAPKLRAKGSGLVVQKLLAEDALAAGSAVPGISDRALRRLCDRLVALGGVRELTGRSSFRIYGL